MSRLKLTMACGNYDRTRALIDGTVPVEGVDLNYLPMVPGETFWRMLNNAEFDVAEMSLSSYTILRSRGDERFIALPVFTSRIFRHSAIYINADAGIRVPGDLKGKRIGVGDYQMTAAVWVRGLLQDDYQVRPEDLSWTVGTAVQQIEFPKNVSISSAGQDAPETLLERGELDALISVMLPRTLNQPDSHIRRLFPDYRQVEMDYYRRSRIFPIMHTVVLRTDLYQAYPWLAISLYKALVRARQLCFSRLYNTDALGVSLPWLIDELEKTRQLMGEHYWDYSIQGSLPTLQALSRYLYEQGLTTRQMPLEQLFVSNIQDGLHQYLHGTGEDR